MAKKKTPPGPAGDMARKIWLAGIGAYGRAFSEAQESIAKVSDETSKYFEDLVERGEEIEDAVETRGREIAKQVTSSGFSMEDRIKEMRERLKLGAVGGESRLDAIEARLAAIEDKLDRIIAAGAPQKRKAAKRKTAKKKTD